MVPKPGKRRSGPLGALYEVIGATVVAVAYDWTKRESVIFADGKPIHTVQIQEVPRVAERQVLTAQTDDALLEIVREPGMTRLPDVGAYALAIQQLELNPALVEMTLYHEETKAIAWRLGYTPDKARQLIAALQRAIILVETGGVAQDG